MFNLLAPWVVLLLCFTTLISCMVRRYKLGLIGILLLLSLNWYWHLLAVGLTRIIAHDRTECFSVVSWNICSTHTLDENIEKGIITIVEEQKATVVFLTEYCETINPKIDSVLCQMYPYKGFLPSTTTLGVFYSSIPIVESVRLGISEDDLLCRYDLKLRDTSIRIYGLHLYSNNMVNGDHFYPDSINDKIGMKRYLNNYEKVAFDREYQA